MESVQTLAACLASCALGSSHGVHGDCEGVLWNEHAMLCFRKRAINVERCPRDGHYTLYVRHDVAPPLPPHPPTPPTPPPWPPLPPAEPPASPAPHGSADRINARFLGGRPTSDVARCGVFVHQNDWESNNEGWGPTGQYADRMAASLITREMPYTFSTSAVGFVLDPAQLTGGTIRCSYPRDGNSMNSADGGCAGGGSLWGADGLPAMMEQSALVSQKWCDGGCGCAWGVSPDDRNGCRYNEVVLDGGLWAARLPEIIEAVFVPIHGKVNHWEGGNPQTARQVRDAFASAHGIYPTDRVPLLTYDLTKAEHGVAPFAQLAPSYH